MIVMWSWSHQAAASWSERRIGRYWTQMHGKLHHLHGLAYHYSPLQFTGALVWPAPPFLLLLPCWVVLLAVFMKQKQEQQGHWNKSFIMPTSIAASIVFLSVVSAMIWIDL